MSLAVNSPLDVELYRYSWLPHKLVGVLPPGESAENLVRHVSDRKTLSELVVVIFCDRNFSTWILQIADADSFLEEKTKEEESTKDYI